MFINAVLSICVKVQILVIKDKKEIFKKKIKIFELPLIYMNIYF